MPSVITLTLGKATIFLFTRKRIHRVQLPRHSMKFETLPSARHVALGKVSVPLPVRLSRSPVPFASSPVRLSRFNFFCLVRHGTRQKFAECPRKGTRQSRLRREMKGRVRFVVSYTRQSSCRVFSFLCRVSVSIGKVAESGSACSMVSRQLE